MSVRRLVYVRRVNSNDNKNVKFYIRKTNRPMTFSLTLPHFFSVFSSFLPSSLSRIYLKLEFFRVRDNKERTPSWKGESLPLKRTNERTNKIFLRKPFDDPTFRVPLKRPYLIAYGRSLRGILFDTFSTFYYVDPLFKGRAWQLFCVYFWSTPTT